ncbi:MAG TPA: epoxide hydrolase N-terminal domain-containing protein [Acidimicrobiales bacterium]|nr:epoxide hydrolase N-terminal domain-containing protein [Acidimicrobiales bacterium]
MAVLMVWSAPLKVRDDQSGSRTATRPPGRRHRRASVSTAAGSGTCWRTRSTRQAWKFITEIDGLDIQFAHLRSPHDDALPLLMTHGWPGSIIEFPKVVEPRLHPGSGERVSERAISGAAELGRAGVSQPHPFTTKSRKAATSPPGNSRRSSPKSCAPRSGRFGR